MHLQVFRIDTGIGNDWPIRQRRSDAAADPQILGTVCFDLFAAGGDGGEQASVGQLQKLSFALRGWFGSGWTN
jgi:hypothetical protein